jgi:hypothetical protein
MTGRHALAAPPADGDPAAADALGVRMTAAGFAAPGVRTVTPGPGGHREG